jgi:hypothetical protein
MRWFECVRWREGVASEVGRHPTERRPTMTAEHQESRRQVYEQIRAKELARGASEDEAARIAAETVDKVLESQSKGA